MSSRHELAEALRLVFLGMGLLGLWFAMQSSSRDVFGTPEQYYEEAPPSDTMRDFSLDVTALGAGKARVRLGLQGLTLPGICSNDTAQGLEGHAHLFVNGFKKLSMYAPETTLTDLPPGEHQITVNFSRPPTHRILTIGGVALSRSTKVRIF